MLIAPLPENEVERLARLHGYGILDTPAERAFDRLVSLAARYFGVPIAAVSLVDQNRLFLKSVCGLDVREASREDSFCAHAILKEEVLVVSDATLDLRFADSPWVTSPAGGVRFYAGAPLRTNDGFSLGTLCLASAEPREFSEADQVALADFAALVVNEMTLRQAGTQLRQEVREHQRTQRTLLRERRVLEELQGTLEKRIFERTADLTAANESLRGEIAGREAVEADLRVAKELAVQANKAKNEFLSRMSHELRTPLNAILGFGQILQLELTDETQRDCLAHVVTAGRHLLNLVNEVLEISRIEAGGLRLSLEPVSLESVLETTLDLVRPLAAARHVCLEIPDRARLGGNHVMADRLRLQQVLLNLLSNAVKYSPAKSRVVIDCRKALPWQLRLSVRDFGPGLTPAEQARLFVAFDRLDADKSGVEGTGLGLALSRGLVHAMQGTIGVESQPGEGCEFWVQLPWAYSPTAFPAEPPDGTLSGAPAAARLPPPDPPPVIPACQVLYIEDNASNLLLVERLLGRFAQVELLTAICGEEGLELARHHQPDVILLDLNLPDIPGLKVLAALRADPRTREIPVAVVSADATRATIERALNAGGSAYLTKPLNVEHLLHTLSALQPTEHPATAARVIPAALQAVGV